MGHHLCAVAAALHGAPAPASGPRRVDEQQRAPRSLAALESCGTRPAEDVDGVPRDSRHEVSHALNAHPCPGWTGQQARNQARLRGQLVQDLAIRLERLRQLDDLDEVAAGVVEDRRGDVPHLGRLRGESHALRSEPIELRLNVVDRE
jgi:hypothetical protein